MEKDIIARALLSSAIMVVGTANAVAQEALPAAEPAAEAVQPSVEAPAAPASAETSSAEPPAPPASGEEPEGLAEIIVTAQRHAERSQDVPISMTTIAPAQLEAQGITSGFDLTKIVPGLVFSQSSSYAVPFLRGVGSTNTSPGDEPSVATYIDGVYYGNPAALALPYGTVANMEVLKGPQGTLFGRNATGGVINVTLRGPEFSYGGVATMAYDNYRASEANLFVTGPLSEKVAASIDIVTRNQDKGYLVDDATGHNVGVNNYAGIRQKFKILASDTVTVDTSLDYQHSGNTTGTYFGTLKGDVPLGAINDSPYPTQNLHTRSNADNSFDLDSWGGSVTVTAELGENTFKSISSYRNVDYTFVQQVGFVNDNTMTLSQTNDGLTLPGGTPVGTRSVTPATTYYNNHTKTPYFATQEFQFISGKGELFDWMAGAYMQFSKDEWAPLDIAYSLDQAYGKTPAFVSYDGYVSTEAYAAFAQGTFHLTDQLDLVGGLRESYEVKKTKADQAVFGNVVASNDQKEEFDGLSYRAGLNYKPSNNALVYLTASRGFKSGLFSIASFGGQPIKPEELNAYEVGFKLQPLSVLRVNGSAFYYDYKDIQVNTVIDTGVTALSNAAEARMKGLELEVQYMPIQRLTLSLSGAYEKAEYRKYESAVVYLPSNSGGNYQAALDVSGNRMPRVPKFTTTTSAHYIVPIGDNTIDFGASYYRSGQFYWTADNGPEQKSYGLLDLSAEWLSSDGKYSVLAYANNASDTEYGTGMLAAVQGNLVQFGRPMVYGTRFKLNF